MVLEIGMRAALIAAASGEIKWQSDLARQRLALYASSVVQIAEATDGADGVTAEPAALPDPRAEAVPRLPPMLAQWLTRWIEAGCDLQTAFETAAGGVRRVARVLGRATRGDWVILLEEFDDAAHTTALAAQFGLTTREAEVLLWLSRGKTNRDIGDILGMAPRTVNKHLEHVFGKLHVETRAAAAAIAAKASTRY